MYFFGPQKLRTTQNPLKTLGTLIADSGFKTNSALFFLQALTFLVLISFVCATNNMIKTGVSNSSCEGIKLMFSMVQLGYAYPLSSFGNKLRCNTKTFFVVANLASTLDI